MKRTFNIIILCCLLYSCNSINKNSVIPLSFKDTINVTPEILKTEKLLSVIMKVKILDSMLVLISDDRNGCIQVFNKNNFKYLYTRGKYGRGPGETPDGNIDIKCINDSIYIYDIPQKTLFIYDVTQFINDNNSTSVKTIAFNTNKYSFDITPLKEHFVSRPTSEARYTLYNRDGKNVSNYSLFPEYFMNAENHNLDSERRMYAYIEPKPDMSKFVSVSHIGGTIEIFNIINDTINKLIEKNYLDPNFENVEDLKSFYGLNTRIGFCGLSVTDNYIYASYSGLESKDLRKKKLVDYIIVFDWNGDAKKLYKVEGGLTDLAVDESQQKMYIITRDQEGNSVIGLIKM